MDYLSDLFRVKEVLYMMKTLCALQLKLLN